MENAPPGAGDGATGGASAIEWQHCAPILPSNTSGKLAKAALAYGRFGWPVIPLRGKIPIIAGGRGYLDASTDPGLLREWWQQYPDANIGVSCIGAGFLVIDTDPRDGGDRTFAELCADHRPLPHTPRQISGGGGSHISFAKPNTDRVRGELGDGVQIKLKGHIVVAPSIHPDTGRAYAWETGFKPSRLPLAPIPTWLTDLILLPPPPKGVARPVIEKEAGWGPKPRYSRAALQRACEAIEAAPPGQQDQTLNREAYGIGRLIGAGLMPRRFAIDSLITYGMSMTNQPGRPRWRECEVIEKVERAVRAGEQNPREVAA